MLAEKIFNNVNKDLSWIKDKTIFITRAGSHSYGTNIETSDEDYRGIVIPPKEYYIGTQKVFEQMEKKIPDATIFSLQKILKLSTENNPSCLELLFTDEKDHVFIDSLGEELIANRDLFPSKLCKERFLGYAKAQFHRIKTHRKFILNPLTKKPERKDFGLLEKPSIPTAQLEAVQATITKQLDQWNPDWEPFSEAQKIWLNKKLSQILAEMKITSDVHWESAARLFGCSDNFIEVLSKERAYSAASKNWDQYREWKENRNATRYAMEEKYGFDGKHGLHLVRLTRMCLEILETGKVIVWRPDAEELLDIRYGKWSYEHLEDYFEKMEVKIKLAFDKSKLRNSPDRKKIDQLCIRLIEKSLSKYSWYNLRKSFKI